MDAISFQTVLNEIRRKRFVADEYKNNYFTSFCQLTQSGVNNIHATIKIGYANALSLGTNRKKKRTGQFKKYHK